MNTEVLSSYKSYLDRQALSDLTRKTYYHRVSAFMYWLENAPDGDKAFTDNIERDFHVREYKQYMLRSGRPAATVNAVLSSLQNLFISRGMPPAKVKRLELPKESPKALEPADEKKLLKAIEKSELRNRTIAMLFMHSGLRISEVVALNLSDISLSARTGDILVRCSKGLKQRTVPINSELRQSLAEYLATQTKRTANEPVFLSQKQTRLSKSSIDRIIRMLGDSVGIELSAHTLRHNFATSLIRQGKDICLVAELLGHSRIETTRRYSLPSEQDKIDALEGLCHAS